MLLLTPIKSQKYCAFILPIPCMSRRADPNFFLSERFVLYIYIMFKIVFYNMKRPVSFTLFLYSPFLCKFWMWYFLACIFVWFLFCFSKKQSKAKKHYIDFVKKRTKNKPGAFSMFFPNQALGIRLPGKRMPRAWLKRLNKLFPCIYKVIPQVAMFLLFLFSLLNILLCKMLSRIWGTAFWHLCFLHQEDKNSENTKKRGLARE